MARFYTVKETAQILGFSTNTIYKFLEIGRLKGVRGGVKQGRFRIPQSQLDSFLDHHPNTNPNQSVSQSVNQPIDQSTNQPSSGALPLLPIKIVRILLIISLIFIVSEILINRNFSPKEQVFRLVIVGIFVILSYQFISFGKNKKSG